MSGVFYGQIIFSGEIEIPKKLEYSKKLSIYLTGLYNSRVMVRQILHLDMDTFFVSVERLLDSRLNGLPVIVGGTSDRGVVASCSYEARKFGVHSAMPARQARKLCPEAVFVKGKHDQYAKYSDMVTQILKEQAPVLEKASIDEHYLDLTGLDKYFGCYKFATELRQRVIRETGLPISFGLSVNKTVSKIATGQAKPNGQIMVEPGTEKAFLAPLSVKKIPGIGDKTFEQLKNAGILLIGSVQQMDVAHLYRLFGDSGTTIWKKCNGIDNSPVMPYGERKSVSKEMTFDKDKVDREQLHRILIRMVDELAFDLRKANMLTSCVAVKIRYTDFTTEQMQQKIGMTASTKKLTEMARELFEKLYHKKTPLRLVGVRLADLVHGTEQMNLFEDIEAQLNLNTAMDAIRKRYGNKLVTRANCLDVAKK